MTESKKKGGGGGWRTVRVQVEIPVQGLCREKDVVVAVKDALLMGDLLREIVKRHPHLKHSTLFGRVRVKSMDRIQRAVAGTESTKGGFLECGELGGVDGG